MEKIGHLTAKAWMLPYLHQEKTYFQGEARGKKQTKSDSNHILGLCSDPSLKRTIIYKAM